MSFEQFYLVELRLFVSIGITNQNKNGFFHCFCLSSSIHPLCVTTSPGHTPGPAPLLPLPTKLIPLDAPSSPSQCPAQTRVHCCNSSTSATPAWGSLSGEQILGIPHRWQGVSTWQCGCRAPFCPRTGCSFRAARVQLSEGRLPPAAGKKSKAWSQVAGAFLHFGKYSRIL